MDVTLFGIVKEVKPLPQKEPAPIVVTLEGINVFLHPTIKVLVAVSMMALQPSRLS